MSLDDRIIEALEGSDTFALTDDPKNSEYMKRIKQAFADEGYGKMYHYGKDGELQAINVHHVPFDGYMTGQAWYDRFDKELYKPKPQEYPKNKDDDEGHDRFFRDGGTNFMYDQAIKAAKKASNL